MLSEFRSQLNKLQVPTRKQAEVLQLLCKQGMVQAEFHEAGMQ